MTDPFKLAGETFASRLLLGTAGYPTQRILVDAVAASGCEIVTVSIRRISLQGPRLRHREPALEVPLPAQHRRLRDGARRHQDGGARARGARHQLGQARSDRRPRDALSRRDRAHRRDAAPRRHGLRRAALLHRRSRGVPAPRRCRRERGDADGLADRLRHGRREPGEPRADLPARAGAGDRRCRHRHRLRRGDRDGARRLGDPAQHRGRQGRRSRADGDGDAPCRRGRPQRASRRPHSAPRPCRAVEPAARPGRS